MRFALSIRLGNDAMQTGDDIAEALHKAAARVADFGTIQDDDAHSGRIMDANGNAVGSWSIS